MIVQLQLKGQGVGQVVCQQRLQGGGVDGGASELSEGGDPLPLHPTGNDVGEPGEVHVAVDGQTVVAHPMTHLDACMKGLHVCQTLPLGPAQHSPMLPILLSPFSGWFTHTPVFAVVKPSTPTSSSVPITALSRLLT